MPTMQLESLPCPGCGVTITRTVTTDQVSRWQGGEYIQNVWPNDGDTWNNDVREQFITGYCARCWTDLFGADTDSTTEDPF